MLYRDVKVLYKVNQNRYIFFFFNDTATTEIYTLSLHDALPISSCSPTATSPRATKGSPPSRWSEASGDSASARKRISSADRKSTRLNSSHLVISYAVFCLKKKTKTIYNTTSVLT